MLELKPGTICWLAILIYALTVFLPSSAKRQENGLVVDLRKNEAGDFILDVKYINKSNSALCVRRIDWEERFLYIIQWFDENNNRIYPYFYIPLTEDAMDTGKYPVFFIIPPGQSINQKHNMSQSWDIKERGIDGLNVRVAIPFVKCAVFERSYIQMPTTAVLGDDVKISESFLVELEKHDREDFKEWYQNGHYAYGEATWIKLR